MPLNLEANRKTSAALKPKNDHDRRGRKRKDHTQSNLLATPASKKQRVNPPLQAHHHREEMADNHAGNSDISKLSRSPFLIQRTSLYLPLSPISQAKPLEALCAEHLSAHILSYYPPLHGILLSYNNAFVSTTSPTPQLASDGPVYAKSIDEYAVSYTWVTADFLVFRPLRGTIVQGHVTLQNENHLSLLCYNQFNASIERKHLPRNWRWSGTASSFQHKPAKEGRHAAVEGEENVGTYLHSDGHPVSGLVSFRVVDFEGGGCFWNSKTEGYISIQGTLLSEEEEEGLHKLAGSRQALQLAKGKDSSMTGHDDRRR